MHAVHGPVCFFNSDQDGNVDIYVLCYTLAGEASIGFALQLVMLVKSFLAITLAQYSDISPYPV